MWRSRRERKREGGRDRKDQDLFLSQFKSGHLSQMWAPRGTHLSSYATPQNSGLKLQNQTKVAF